MQDLIRQTPVQAESREQLQALLNRASGGVIFTTLQKFGEVAEPLTLRSNVVVIADEAHRSQYGLKARMDVKTGKVSYGFAKYMRDALPHASFIGFTGTPIEATDVNTPALFGNYIDIYDISRAVEDGATVPSTTNRGWRALSCAMTKSRRWMPRSKPCSRMPARMKRKSSRAALPPWSGWWATTSAWPWWPRIW